MEEKCVVELGLRDYGEFKGGNKEEDEDGWNVTY